MNVLTDVVVPMLTGSLCVVVGVLLVKFVDWMDR